MRSEALPPFRSFNPTAWRFKLVGVSASVVIVFAGLIWFSFLNNTVASVIYLACVGAFAVALIATRRKWAYYPVTEQQRHELAAQLLVHFTKQASLPSIGDAGQIHLGKRKLSIKWNRIYVWAGAPEIWATQLPKRDIALLIPGDQIAHLPGLKVRSDRALRFRGPFYGSATVVDAKSVPIGMTLPIQL